ncbi:MAG: fibronectin type III domain-containing protein, partial [Oscillospiraceae bacterium]
MKRETKALSLKKRIISALMAVSVAISGLSGLNAFAAVTTENEVCEEYTADICGHEHDLDGVADYSEEKNGVVLTWPVPGYTSLSQGYKSGTHNGIDIAGGGISGTNVVAAYGGVVYRVYTCTHVNCMNCTSDNCGGIDCDGFGTGVIIRGYDGRYYQYAHMMGGSIPSGVTKGATVAQGQVIGQVGSTGASTGPHLHFEINTSGAYSGSVNPMAENYNTHSHSYTCTEYVAPDCVNTGRSVFTCSCGDSYTETVPALGHSDEVSYIKPTMTEPGNVKYTCTRCGRSYLGDEIAAPEKGDNGWYYCDMLPDEVTADKYVIEYDNYYEAVQETSPGSDWVQGEVAVNEWLPTGNIYSSWYELPVSESRVLIDSYYYHYCSGSTGSVVNYEATSTYVHGDMVGLDVVYVDRTGLDGDITYYILKWKSDGTTVYCGSGVTCDGSYGTHGARGYAWYKMNWYQDRYQVLKYRFTKDTGWVDYSDAAAARSVCRFKMKNTAPQNLTATAGDGKVTLTWDEVDGATAYTVKGGTDATVYAKSIKTNTATVTGLTNGKEYTFRVFAYVDGKWSGATAIKATPVTTTPQNLKATAGDGKVTLTWDKVDGATAYTIKGGSDSTIYAKSITANTYTVSGLKNGTTYTFRVFAYVNGKWSAAAAVKATPVTTTPQNLKATAGDGKITLSWDEVPGATAYTVKGGSDSTIYAKSITANTYTISGLKNGTTYTFRVFAYVNGKWSAAAAIKATPVTTTPQNLKATVGDGKVTLTWDKVDGATAYTIKGGSDSTVYAKSITANTYTISGLKNGTTYIFRVFAYAGGK